MATSSSVPTTSTTCPTDVTTKEPIRLVLCFDGTSNTFHGTDQDTNVVKLLRKLNRHHPNQYHYYQTGIGTYEEDDASVNKSKIAEAKAAAHELWDQCFASTFDSHVMEGYKFLMKYYEQAAKIYIFGFSRGAYTAKFLAQMINTLGLLCRGNDEMVPFAYRVYQKYVLKMQEIENCQTCKAERAGHDAQDEDFLIQLVRDYGVSSLKCEEKDTNEATKGKGKYDFKALIDRHTREHSKPYEYKEEEKSQDLEPEKQPTTALEAALAEVQDFGGTFCRRDPTISKLMFGGNIKVHFLGLWDCVNSVAVLERSAEKPMPVFGTARYIRHAVAIDERRVKFRPSLLFQDIRAKKDTRVLEKIKKIVGSGPISKEIEEAISEEVSCANKEDIKEVWFPGGHGDVGGGWPIEDSAPTTQGWGQRAASYLPGHKPLCSAHKFECGKSKTSGPRIQMSDVPLAWMIDEILAVDKTEEEKETADGKKVTPGLAWNYHRLKRFKDAFHSWKAGVVDPKLNLQADLGTIHDSLSLKSQKGLGTSLMWNALEYTPLVPRYELKDNQWQSSRFSMSMGSRRNIPANAVLHESVLWRLLNKKETYKPNNYHGRRDSGVISCDELTIHPDLSINHHKMWTFQTFTLTNTSSDRIVLVGFDESTATKGKIMVKPKMAQSFSHGQNHWISVANPQSCGVKKVCKVILKAGEQGKMNPILQVDDEESGTKKVFGSFDFEVKIDFPEVQQD